MRFKSVVFDLDDTLYSEYDFIKGGYQAVANHLSEKFSHPVGDIYKAMLDRYKNKGRGKLFDYILEKYSISDSHILEELVSIYRRHKPSIKLHQDARLVIDKLKSLKVKLGLITDGIKIVQETKVKKLGLEKTIDKIIYSDDLGAKSNKLSALPFKKMADFLKTKFINSCYIGDDPFKDFYWPNKLGMTSIRINRGRFKNITHKKKAFMPQITILNLEETFKL